jgi:hypothetical protein
VQGHSDPLRARRFEDVHSPLTERGSRATRRTRCATPSEASRPGLSELTIAALLGHTLKLSPKRLMLGNLLYLYACANFAPCRIHRGKVFPLAGAKVADAPPSAGSPAAPPIQIASDAMIADQRSAIGGRSEIAANACGKPKALSGDLADRASPLPCFAPPITPRIRSDSCLTSATLARPPACQGLPRSRGGRRADRSRDIRACCRALRLPSLTKRETEVHMCGFSTSTRPARTTARSTSGAAANRATRFGSASPAIVRPSHQTLSLAAGSPSLAARSRRASRQGSAVLLRAGGMPRRSVASARQRVAGGAHRVVALGGMTAVYTSRSRGPAGG